MKFRVLIQSLMLAAFVINTTAQNTDLFKRRAIEAGCLWSEITDAYQRSPGKKSTNCS